MIPRYPDKWCLVEPTLRTRAEMTVLWVTTSAFTPRRRISSKRSTHRRHLPARWASVIRLVKTTTFGWSPSSRSWAKMTSAASAAVSGSNVGSLAADLSNAVCVNRSGTRYGNRSHTVFMASVARARPPPPPALVLVLAAAAVTTALSAYVSKSTL